MGPRVGLDVSEKIKTFYPYRDSKPEPSSLYRSRYTDYTTLAREYIMSGECESVVPQNMVYHKRGWMLSRNGSDVTTKFIKNHACHTNDRCLVRNPPLKV